MVILDYNKKNHKQIIHACAEALKQGKILAYPTDTCYGLAVDVGNIKAVKNLFKVKGRNFNKPISIIPHSLVYMKKIVVWGRVAEKLSKHFFPGAVTLILKLKAKSLTFRVLSAKRGELGIRQPKNSIALDLAKYLKRPITTTSANVSGKPECYSLVDLQKQFAEEKHKPDIIINAGILKYRRPSTVVMINRDQSVQILRSGPVLETQIKKILNPKS